MGCQFLKVDLSILLVRFFCYVNIQLESIFIHIISVKNKERWNITFSDYDSKYLLRVSSFFETLKDRCGETGQFFPCVLRIIFVFWYRFKKLPLVEHNDEVLRKA
jgi:hypothetical protein